MRQLFNAVGNFVFSIVSKLCSNRIEMLKVSAVRDYRRTLREKEINRKADMMAKFIGMPLVYVFEDIRNPIIGFGELIKIDPITGEVFLQVKNYVKNETLYINEVPFHFDESIMHNCYMIDSVNLVNLVHHRKFIENGQDPEFHTLPVQEKIHTLPMLMRTLETNGFYENLKRYRQMVEDYQEKRYDSEITETAVPRDY